MASEKKRITFYRSFLEKLVYVSRTQAQKSDIESFEAPSLKNRDLVDQLLEKLVLPQSNILGFEQLQHLEKLSAEGKSCLLLLEHYSNFDIPSWYYLLKKRYTQAGLQFSSKIISMATTKLIKHSEIVKAFAQAYPRIPVISARDIDLIRNDPAHETDVKNAVRLNHLSFKRMISEKNKGSIVLIFPGGTRFRPSRPETKRPIVQMDSFIKHFDYMVFVGSSGILLEVDENGDMANEFVQRDILVYNVGPVQSCSDYRNRVMHGKELSPSQQRELMVEAIAQDLQKVHDGAAAIRKEKLQELDDDFDFYKLDQINT